MEIPLVSGSFEALTTLNEKFDIYIVTSRHAVVFDDIYYVVYASNNVEMAEFKLSWSN